MAPTGYGGSFHWSTDTGSIPHSWCVTEDEGYCRNREHNKTKKGIKTIHDGSLAIFIAQMEQIVNFSQQCGHGMK